jgi:hypothetical protein
MLRRHRRLGRPRRSLVGYVTTALQLTGCDRDP